MLFKFTDLYYKPSSDFPSDIKMLFVHPDLKACLVFESSFFEIVPISEIKLDQFVRYDFDGNNSMSEIEIIEIKEGDSIGGPIYISCNDKSIIKVYFLPDNYEGQVFQCFSVYRHNDVDETNQKEYDRISKEFFSVRNVRLAFTGAQ